MNIRTWSTRCWVDGHANVHNVSWRSKEDAIEQSKIAMAGTPFVAACEIVRLEVIGTRFVDGKREEVIQHAWKQTSSGRFITRVSDGTEIL